MTTLIHDGELPITPEDCAAYVGSTVSQIMQAQQQTEQRLGQFWMNMLELPDRRKLTDNWEYDPWERDNWLSIQRALMFLLEN